MRAGRGRLRQQPAAGIRRDHGQMVVSLAARNLHGKATGRQEPGRLYLQRSIAT